ncbi:hypothetical protein OIO90_005094 [Microbotryomycetes sp. JL221]|nr:hypothetical protein OIO90_005094 [Microbotryomycetes sp. JL221]
MSYTVPRNLIDNPDVGLNVDILEPAYEHLPLFSLSSTRSAIWSPSESSLDHLVPISIDDANEDEDEDEDEQTSSADEDDQVRRQLVGDDGRNFGTHEEQAPLNEGSGNSMDMSLKIQLVTVTRTISWSANDTSGPRQRNVADAMFAMFTGQSPAILWPTPALVGCDDPFGNAHRKQLRKDTRLDKGALRGMTDWMDTRGEHLTVCIPPDSSRSGSDDLLGVVKGFALQIRKRTPLRQPAQTTVTGRRDIQAVRDRLANLVARRLGVGANGGPAILWNGREQDPDQRRGVAVIRANQEQDAGFVFRVPNEQVNSEAGGGEAELEQQEEVVQPDGEEFFPVKAPARPVSAQDTPTSNVEGDVFARSLSGLWVGPYGGHGLEFGHFRLVAFITSVRVNEGSREDDSDDVSYGEIGLARPCSRTYRVSRLLEFVKVTGDANIPSGQVSLQIHLGDVEFDVPVTSSRDEIKDVDDFDDVSIGTITSITYDQFLQYCDPATRPAHQDWGERFYVGNGRVALTGFVNPSRIGAEFVFIKSTVDVGQGHHQHVVDEIRVRWLQLGKVACFRRVRM